jgi:signal transduction histidine kinase
MNDQPVKKTRLKWFYSLKTRFILLISGILIVIFALVAFFLIDDVRNTLTNNLNSDAKAFSSLSVQPIGQAFETYSQSGSILIGQQMQQFTSLDSNVSNIAIVGLNGVSQFSLNGQAIRISAAQASNFTSSMQRNSDGQIVRVVQPFFDNNGQHSYAVVYFISTKSLGQSISREELLILIFTVLALFISSAASYMFINGLFLSPIAKLSKSARVIATGSYDQQINSKRHDEIGTLAGSLNQMANSLKSDINKLEEVDKLKTEFITIASHNLRTPISIIQGYVDILKKGIAGTDTKKAIDTIGSSTDELADFTEQMLTIADVDSIRSAVFLQSVTLNDLLQPLVNDYGEITKTKGLKFQTSIGGGEAHIKVNRRQLASAVHNLLDNAVKFTEAGGTITLESSADANLAEIRVKDTGMGIASSEFPKMFTKFHRGTDVLRYNFKGVGIGLYVTKLIVDQHGGSISFESQLGKGSTFIIKIPVAPAK